MADAPYSSDAGDSPPLSASDGSQRLFFSHDLVFGTYRGHSRFGLVRLIHGEDSESEEEVVEEDVNGDRKKNSCYGGAGGGAEGNPRSDTAGEASRFGPLKTGYVRVQWYPEGIRQDVKETKLQLEDRSLVPRDVVRQTETKVGRRWH